MPTRVLKRRGAPAASSGAAVPSVASTRGPVAVTPSSASERAAPLPVSSSPPGLGLGRPEPSGVDTMSDVSVVAAIGGLLSLGGGGSAPVADAQDVDVDTSTEATAVHVDIITKAGDNANDNEQRRGAGKETSDPPVPNKKRKRNGNGNKTCKLPGCDKYAQSGAEGYCCAHHTELVMGDKRPSKPVPRIQHKKARKTQKYKCKLPGCEKEARTEKGAVGYCCAHHTELVGAKGSLRKRKSWRKSCKLEGCEKEARPEKRMEGYCQAHHTEFVLGVVKPKVAATRMTGARICSVAGCQKQVQQGRFCCTHGAKTIRSLCSHSGCTNASKRGGLCRRHGAFNLKTCVREGCKRVAVHGTFCSAHTEGCVEAGCGSSATSGYYCQRHYVKPPPRKTVKSKGKGIKRARKIKKAEESAPPQKNSVKMSGRRSAASIASKKRSHSEEPVNDCEEKSYKRTKKAVSFQLRTKEAVSFQLDHADEARVNVAIAAVQTRYGTGAEGNKKLASLTVRGVTMRPSGKWQAQVFYAKKSRYLGIYPSRTQAVLAYEVAREILDQESSVGDAERSVAVAREAARKASALAEGNEG